MLRSFSGFTPLLKLTSPTTLQIPVFRVLDLNGKVLPGAETYVRDLDKSMLSKMMHTMLQVDQMDKLYLKLQRLNYIPFYISSQGEEGVQVGCAAALQPEDWLCLQYREMGICLYRGMQLRELADQLQGNTRDINKGHQMPLLYSSTEAKVQSISPPLGTQIPHAAGIGYALRMQGKPHICLGVFGDGAASEGDAHAGLQFAATLKSQTLFFCRNNGYAISTPSWEQSAALGVAQRGVGYGIPALKVDGNDPIAVLLGTRLARETVLGQPGPVLLEALTYRRGHHSTSDDSSLYRSQQTLKHYETVDNPILRFYSFLKLHGLAEAELEVLRTQAATEVKEAWEHARDVPLPDWEIMFSDVYDQLTPALELQKQEFKEHYSKYKQYYDSKVLH